MRNYSNIFEILQSLRHQLKTAKVFLPQPVFKSEKGSLILVDEEYLNPNEDEAMDTTRDMRLRQCQ